MADEAAGRGTGRRGGALETGRPAQSAPPSVRAMNAFSMCPSVAVGREDSGGGAATKANTVSGGDGGWPFGKTGISGGGGTQAYVGIVSTWQR